MHPPLALRLALVLGILTLLLGATRAARAEPVDPKAIPDPMKPWIPWVLDGKEDKLCPGFQGRPDVSRCAWPASLDLALDDHGGRFTQRWHMDARKWAPLPGDDKRWPGEVKVDGAAAAVALQGGAPAIALAPGDHTVAGSFAWDAMPESLHVPLETGVVTLTLRGAAVAIPNRDAQGVVWLQKAAKSEEGDALEFVVHRKIQDGVPTILTTRIELRVAGKSREELLGRPLLAGFTPLSLDSPLPARLEPDGRLRVQLRPGVFVLELAARSDGPVTKLTRPDPGGPWRPGEEVWVFAANPDVRVVTLTGVPSIDPQQTTLPEDWKRLPAYPLKVGDAITLEEKRRGDADPPPNQLALARTLWLDFDGAGFAVHDAVTGTLNRDARLTMAPPTVLGRVSIGGHDQFITRMGEGDDAARAGVEIRQGELSVDADSRIPGDASDVPAVGWAHDFHQVTGTLNLPPGWRLLHASGVDEVPGTWLRRWTLLEVFLTLVLAIGLGRLYGVGWGAAALATLVLTLPEEGAPRWSWLVVLALEAIVRVVPKGRVKQTLAVARFGALLVVAAIALPFAVAEVRSALHPALESSGSVLAGDTGAYAESGEVAKGAPAEAPTPPGAPAAAAALPQGVASAVGGGVAAKAPADRPARPVDDMQRAAIDSTLAKSRVATLEQQNAAVYDPSAVVQTGPGLPRWRWTSLDSKWSGPVAATQRLRLYLLPPPVNMALGLLRAALLLLLAFRLLPWADRLLPRRLAGVAAALLLALSPGVARADVPDKDLLEELGKRLTRPADCAPSCASSGRMLVEARGDTLRARVEVDAAAPTAVPLPGASGQWTPARVLVDGKPAKAVARVDGTLWVEVPKGRSEIVLEGPMPEGETMQLALPLKPHRVEVQASGWTVAGLHEDGLADDALELTRVRGGDRGKAGASLQPGALPPFVRVERTLEVGLNWQVSTRIVRVSPPGSAIVVEVPLLAGESVTTADVRVEGGKALVNMGARTQEVAWRSVLEERSPVKLVAPKGLAWFEVWRTDVSPVWHATVTGIPPVHTARVGGVSIPEWHPWPGEEATVELVRPEGVPGQTLTIDESTLTVAPGVRATDVTLNLDLRSSRGTEHTLTLPEGAELESLTINGAAQPIRQDKRRVTVPLVPGAQRIAVAWRETPGVEPLFASPEVDLGAPSVNDTVTVTMPGSRWVLWTSGPAVGPAVLFWGLLLVLGAVSIALGRSSWTPMRGWQWFLLSIGLSQVSVVAGGVFVGWLFALGWRRRNRGEDLAPAIFDLRQALLALWTVVALVILGVSLYQGLLGAPEMQLAGNGSTPDALRWFSDRSGPALPRAHVLSVPIMVYRAAMLGWALWIALALLGWLRWGWAAFTEGGAWKKSPPRVRPHAPPVQGPPPGAPPASPAPGG